MLYSEKYHTLAVIYLTGLTLRVADTSMSMSDGNYYDGRLSVQTLTRSFSSFLQPKQRQSTISLTIADEDGTFQALIRDYHFGYRDVEILVGKGTSLDDYIIDFKGVIQFPNGVTHTEKSVTINVRDIRSKDDRNLPVNKYWASDYPNIEEDAIGSVKPLIWGNWSDTPLPATCIDTTIPRFSVGEGTLKEITQVYKNGSPIVHTDEDLVNGEFTISSYTPGDDIITVAVQGRVNGPGELMESINDIVYDIQVGLVEIDPGNIDLVNYADVGYDFSSFRLRRYLNTVTSSNTLLEQIMVELNIDLYISSAGLYTMEGREPGVNYDYVYDETNILPDTFNVEYDPEGLYANRFIANYKYNPINQNYMRTLVDNNTQEQASLGQVESRTFDLLWLYIEDDAIGTVTRKKLLMSTWMPVVTFSGTWDAIYLGLTDRVLLNFGDFVNRPLYIRRVVKNFKNKIAQVSGYDMISFTLPGAWVSGESTNPNLLLDAPLTNNSARLGLELVTNGDMEIGDPPSDWNIKSSTTFEQVDESGNFVGKITGTNGSRGVYQSLLMSGTLNKTYYVTGRHKGESANGSRLANNVETSFASSGALSSASWADFSYYGYDPYDSLYVFLYTYSALGNISYYDDITVREFWLQEQSLDYRHLSPFAEPAWASLPSGLTALLFNGSTDGVDCGDEIIGAGDVTFVGWVRIDSLGSGSSGIYGTILNNGKFSITLNDSGGPRIQFTSDGYSTIIYGTRNDVVYGLWHHLVITRAADGTTNIYINTALSGSADQNSGTPAAGVINLCIGNNSSASRCLDGACSLMRVYDYILSSDEIAADYNESIGYFDGTDDWSVESPDFLDSTDEQRNLSGYWTNDDGEADPGDPTSTGFSNWW